MVAKQHYTRINTIEPKDLIYQRIGHQRAEKYFDLLKNLFSLKLKKTEFDKLCIQTIGKENTPLHNHLIQSILKNACHAKVPPVQVKKVNKPNNKVNSLQSIFGDAAFPPSPRKNRSPISKDRKFHDRPSPLGPLGKTPSGPFEEVGASELNSLGSRPPVEVMSVEDGEEVEQVSVCSHSVQSRSQPVTAPLGVFMKGCGARKSLLCGGSSLLGALPDTTSLRTRLERKLEVEGINVSVECVNVLNNGLDVYMKRLIEPCMGLAKARLMKQQSGLCKEKCEAVAYGSMLDFRVAMESDPWILGGDWAVQLEKICSREFKE